MRGPDDAVLRRWRGAGSSTWPTGGSTGTTTGGRWWYLSDQQGSVVGLIDSSANVTERIRYDAYGNALHHRGYDVDGDRDADSADASAITTLLATSSGSIPITASTYKAEYDLNRDGAITSADSTLVSSNTGAALTAGLISLGGASTSGGIGGAAGPDNPIGYAGYVFNAETRIYTVRFRHYWAALGTWTSRDPAGYVDGMNLYEYVGGCPMSFVDPSGLLLGEVWDWFTGGAPAEEIDAIKEAYCVQITKERNSGKICQEEFRQRALNAGCGFSILYEEGTGFAVEFGKNIAKGAAATADGIIPFANPFEGYYDKDDGWFKASRFFGGVARDAIITVFIPNITVWLKNPVLYEIGQTTLPHAMNVALRGLTALEKGKALVDLGRVTGAGTLIRHILTGAGQLRYTWDTGGTPGGRILLVWFWGTVDRVFFDPEVFSN